MVMLRNVLAMSLALWMNAGFARSQVIVAHRGASHDAPENTLAAFQLAWQQKSDGIEADFHLTADGKIVCIHDPDTERTAGVRREVKATTFSELRQLEYGGWKGPRWNGQVIPALDEVLQAVPDGKLLVIELKSKRQIVPILAAELRRLDTSSIRLMIISFHEDTVQACKQQVPWARVHWLTRFAQADGSREYHPTAAQIAATVNRIGADGVGLHGKRDVIDAEFIRQLQSGGCDEFHVWTIDSIDDAKYFQSLGAVGITTNRPDYVGDALRNASELEVVK